MMSGETEERPSGWTVDTAKHYLEALLREKDLRDSQRFDQQQLALREALIAQEKAVNAALAAAQQAVNKAEVAAEKRFDSTNEFRAQLADQAATLMPRREYDTAHQALIERIDDLKGRMDRGEGGSSGQDQLRDRLMVGIVACIAFAGVIVSLFAVFK